MSDTSYPAYQHYGTNAQRLAFTPSPPASGKPIYIWYETDTGSTYLYDTSWHALSTASPGTVTHTGALTANALVIGNGTDDIKVTTTGTGIVTALGINTGSAGAPVLFNGALGTPSSGTLSSAVLGSTTAYLNYQDQKAQGTQSGSFTSGAWRTRTLNTEVTDVGGYGTLASNQITLAAGTYVIRASAPAYFVNNHQTRLMNVTDATMILPGTSEYASTLGSVGDGPMTRSEVSGLFTIAASKALELQHQCTTTCNTNGFGNACNFTTEVYAVVELWRLA